MRAITTILIFTYTVVILLFSCTSKYSMTGDHAMRAVGKNGCVPRGSLQLTRNTGTSKLEFSLKDIGGTTYIAFNESFFHPEGTTGGITYPALYLKTDASMLTAWNSALSTVTGDPNLTKLAVGICGRSILHNASAKIYYFEEGALIYDSKMLYPKDSDCLNARLKKEH